MNHRERMLAAIRHQPVDRLPTFFDGTPEVQDRLLGHFGLDPAGKDARQVRLALLNAMDIDGTLWLGPEYRGPTVQNGADYAEDEWGFRYRNQKYGTGSYDEQIYFPLAAAETISDIDAYRWPDIEWYDFSVLSDMAKSCGGRAIECGYTGIFYFHNKLRGLEQSLMDPIVNPEFTRHLLRRLSDFFYEFHRRSYEAGLGVIDLTQVTDDYGSQTGLLISPAIFDDFYREHLQRAIDLAKSYGILVMHHDDGDIRPLLPTLVEMGIDLLDPVQWRCGNWDLAEVKRSFGSKICFHGAVDNQQTMPFGGPDDVRTEVKRLIETLASDRTGFIVGPCHAIQPNTTTENILALYDAAREFGTFKGA